jgi:anti-sigma factor RsiW
VTSSYSNHVTDEELLRALDGELSAPDLEKLHEHIKAC